MDLLSFNIAHIHGKNRLSDMRGYTNILGLKTPNEFHCQIIDYKAGHSVLQIKIYEPASYTEKSFILTIENVFYMACPKHWEGANFRLASEAETILFLRKFSQYQQVPDWILKDLSLLMILEDSPIEIMICATNFTLFLEEYRPQFINFEPNK